MGSLPGAMVYARCNIGERTEVRDMRDEERRGRRQSIW